jgi:hypothetical protein
LADPRRAPAAVALFPAQEIGGHLEENAPTVGQPRNAQAVTESAGKVARHLTVQRAMT